MNGRVSGIPVLAALAIVGCSSVPTDVGPNGDEVRPTDTEAASVAGTGVIEEQLSDKDTQARHGCRKETTTGTHVKRLTCKPPEDDSELIPLISAPRH